jgi:hypothetical protein
MAMPDTPPTHPVYLEIGKRRVFAGAVEWPGWCRSGRDEASAIQALLDVGPRYAHSLRSTGLGFVPPQTPSSLHIVERLAGNATTDFGAPAVPLSGDTGSIATDELRCLQTILKSCWAAFDEAIHLAEGKQLRKGPRGGGREVVAIVDHVLQADANYLRRIGWRVQDAEEDEINERLDRMRRAILDGLAASARGELPTVGPRGAKRWQPRYFVRRVAWHVLDHAWEIEDRIP